MFISKNWITTAINICQAAETTAGLLSDFAGDQSPGNYVQQRTLIEDYRLFFFNNTMVPLNTLLRY